MTREQYDRWRVDVAELESMLTQFKRNVEKLLLAEGWPTDPERIVERMAAGGSMKGRGREKLALHALLAVRDTWSHVQPTTQNAGRAAETALRAGVIAGNLGINVQAGRAQIKRSLAAVEAKQQKQQKQVRKFERDVDAYFAKHPGHSFANAAQNLSSHQRRRRNGKMVHDPISALAKRIERHKNRQN